MPRLWDALHEETMIELLADHLPVLRCRPCYVRYKPATSCLVRYDVALQRPSGDVVETTAHITMYADDRGRVRAGNNRMRRLLETASRYALEWSGRLVAYLPELNGLVQVFPLDYDLRPLVQVANPAFMREVFSASLPPDTGTVSLKQPHLVRYKPGRKALFRFELEHGAHDRLYAKLLEDDRGEILFAATSTLRNAGIATPRALATTPDLRLITHEHASGVELASRRGTPGYAQWMEPVATSLVRLQAVELPTLPVRTLADEAATIVQTARWLGLLLPALAPRLTRLGERIGRELTRQAQELSTVHGDFYDDQILVSDSGVTIIDLDELHRGHRLGDVGNMLAHLRSGDARGDGTGTARERFLGAALAGLPYTAGDVAVFEAAALLKLAPGPFRRLEKDWPERVEQIVGLVGTCLRESRRSFRGFPGAGPEAIEDSKLPHLPALQDHDRMAREVSGMGTLRAIELVRHKPGRRAILRYTVLRQDGRVEHLYAKTFASERGPRVFAVTRAITDARAFGADVQLPEPVAFLPSLKAIVQRSVPGQPAESALLDGDQGLAIRIATRVATALHRLHTSGIDLGRRHDMDKELAPLPGRVEDIRDGDPSLLPLALECLGAIETATLVADWPWRWQPIHRDIYHDQVLVDGDGLAILDLDDAAMSEPAIDIANFAAHLRLLGIQRHGAPNALAEVIDAFLDQSLKLDPDLDRTLLDFLQATTLLRLAGIHISRRNGIRVATLLLDECASLLSLTELPGMPRTHGT
jgi:Ser/Thr protein kinase RdoA (MazF antagonist)